MDEQGLSKSEMARRMRTSRPALDRLLDPANESVTLNTLQKAARALGRELHLELVMPRNPAARLDSHRPKVDRGPAETDQS
jgi:transcriptional regulator with XRE-family HTH domain